MKKRLLSIILTMCMVLTLLPTIALAAETTGTFGAFTVTYDGTAPTYDSNVLTLGSGTYSINGTTTADRIVVTSGATAYVTLNNVNIDMSAINTACPFNMTGATVYLTLSGDNVLKSGVGAAGLQVPDGASLIITKASTGSLESTAKNGVGAVPGPGAGIGGGSNQAGGAVTINGGTVTATGGGSTVGPAGAGIGGSCNNGSGKSGGTVTINGGTVTATGVENSAGIGGGGSLNFGGGGGTVTITGGTVIANGGSWRGAGIGGGGSIGGGDGATVVITGGSVKAVAGGNGAEAIGYGSPGWNHGTLKNETGEDVTLYTLTLPGAISTAVTVLTTTPTLDKPYGTTDMKTDANGKLYLYLPAGKTAINITTAAGTYAGNITGAAVTLSCVGHPVSGTVNAGTTGAVASGLTVNLYVSTDTAFATSIGSATTDGSGAYTISGVPNGSYVARVSGAPGSYAASVSNTIIVNSSAVGGANITLSRAAYSGDAASTPTLISKTDTQVVLGAVTVAGQTVEYGKNTSNTTPTAWQNSTTFTDLAANTTYYFFARVKETDVVEAGGVSSSLSVTTKNTAPAAPTLNFSSISSDSVYITLVAGAEYSKDNGANWQISNEFTELSAATEYFFAIRIKETVNTAAGVTASQSRYTMPERPSAGVGYSINYITEKITVTNGYEVNTNTDFGAGTVVPNNVTLISGNTYYIRVAANGGVPASESVSFTVAARPTAPAAILAADITRTDTVITISNTVAQQEYQVNGTWYTPVNGKVEVTGLDAGTEYSILTRVKASAINFAGDNSETLTVRTKLASTALSNSGVTYSVKNGTVTGLGSTYEYSLDNGATWKTTPVTGVTFAAGNVIKVRTRETDDAMPSLTQALGTIAVPATAPSYIVDFASETTTDVVTVTAEYNTSSATATTWTAGDDVALPLVPGTTYHFRVAATDGALAGNVQTLAIPARPAAPDVSAVTIAAGEDASHTAITLADTYEYILADALPELSASGTAGTGSVTEIAATEGQHVYIRVKATVSAFASDWTNCGELRLGVDDINLTGVDYDVAAGTLTGTTTNMQYSLDGGSIWQDCAEGNTTGLTFVAGTVKVRQKDKVTNEVTVTSLTTPAASGAPTLESKTYNSVTLTAMTGYEYSKDGGATWQDSNIFSGLSSNTEYSFVARNKATAATLPGTVSTSLTVTTDIAPSGGGINSGNSSAPVIVDGKIVNIGTENKTGDTTTVTVDQSKLGKNIGGAPTGSSVVVPVSKNGAATASLVVKNIEDMAQKGMTLTVQTGSVAYNLNTSAIDTAALTAAFPGADMSKVPFDVTVQNSSVSVEGETLVLSPVAFTVTATYNGKTVNVDTFSAYINRVIEVTEKQAAKITTAVVINTDGSTRHVPTNVIEKDGKYYAIINSRTNSTYALIQNEVTFADASGKWYEAAVNEMGSRKIIEGRSASVFDGGASITRAEFAAILVRALGLPADGTSSFSDVPTTAWYTGAVATAAQYGLVAGKGKNRFDPNAAITRQEAMLMLQQAAVLTELSGASSALDGFVDAHSVGTWAEDAVKWSVGSGIIQGANGKLNPTANITRAESATIILRLLQKAGLVDVRS